MLDGGEIEEINRVSLKVLDEVGVEVYHERVRDILAQHGARVEGERVRLAPEMVAEALAVAPSVVKFMDRRGKELPLVRGNLIWGAGSSQYPWVVDVNGSRRPTAPEDVVRMTRLIDALPRFDVIHVAEGPLEGVPEPLTNLRSIALFFANSHKHAAASPARVTDAECWFDLAEITLSGGDLAQKPVVSMAVSTTSPLQLDPVSGQILLESIERGVPVRGLPAPMAGATTPVTLAGTLVLMNAELLFLVTATEYVREGAPIVYGGVGAIMNLQTGAISMGSPEFPMFVIAHAQMGRYHNLPTYAPFNVTDATRVDVQAGGEWVLQQFCGMASSLQYTIVAPSVNNSLATSPEAMLLASDFLDVVERVYRGITVTEETLAFDAIARVGPGGHFLADEHTMRFMRSGEHHYGGGFERGGSWKPEDAALYRAHERVEALVNEHVPEVPDTHLEEIERYVARRSKELVD
jgi:trimethylamine--corrinoid protein Co-methyltransferase